MPGVAACCSSAAAVGILIAAALQVCAADIAPQCPLVEPWPPHAQVQNGASFDFIVVGGGTAGSTVAARLAEVDSFTVLLVEAGPDPPRESIIPSLHPMLLAGPFDWNFTTVSDGIAGQALAGGRHKQPRGKMLGGSGSINNMIYARGFPADYDEWAATAGPEWTWDNVLPYFKKTERMTDQNIINNEDLMKYHGSDGEIEVSGLKQAPKVIDWFLEAFREIGFKIVDDMTNPNEIGAGKFSHTIRDGKRHSSLTALLNNAKGNNLFVLKDALATKIIFIKDKAVGVKVLINNEELDFYAKKEVVVSAGTFNTPKLLMLSGIGPKEHLESFSINVVKDLPAVGGNLHDHVMFLNYIVAETGICFQSEASIQAELAQYLYDGSGPLANADSMGALLALNSSEANTPDFAFYPTCTQIGTNFYVGCVSVIGLDHDICDQINVQNQDHELLSIAVVLLKPKSRGKVRLRSKDPHVEPFIYSGTFENLDDLEGFPRAVDVVHRLAETEYFKEKSAKVLNVRVKGCDGLVGSEEVKCKARAMGTSAWHAVGTSAMGAVVDPELKVQGVKGLRVVDASVMPQVTRGNTNAPVVMIAEKAAEFIRIANGAK